MQTTTRARVQRLERDLTNANMELDVLRTMLTPSTYDELEDWISKGQDFINYHNSVPVDAPLHPLAKKQQLNFIPPTKAKEQGKEVKYLFKKRETRQAVFYVTDNTTFGDSECGFWIPKACVLADDPENRILTMRKNFRIKKVNYV